VKYTGEELLLVTVELKPSKQDSVSRPL